MRMTGLAAALVLICGTAGAPAQPIEITAEPPGSVEVALWCSLFPNSCRRQADEAARAHCFALGTKARFVRSALLRRSSRYGEKGFFLYDCVR